MPAGTTSVRRNRRAEISRATAKQASQVSELAAARHDGTLGDEVIKMAQALIMCSLPYSRTDETEVTREARLGDGSTLRVTFIATEASRGTAMPFGADRHLLAWIFDRAISGRSAFIEWESASEYRREMGLTIGGSGHRQLVQRFERIAALFIRIERSRDNATATARYPIVEKQFLPKSITGKTLESEGQQVLPELRGRYGFSLNQSLYEDIVKHHVVLPRKLWRELDGPSQITDLVYWLYARCYAARTPSRITWEQLQPQFPEGSNPWRFRAYVRKAVAILKTVWPHAKLEVTPNGIEVDYSEPLLPDDPSKGRQRRLASPY